MLDQMSACRNEHERLQLMFGRAPGFMALLEGPEHNIVLANKAFAEFVGKPVALGQIPSDLLPNSPSRALTRFSMVSPAPASHSSGKALSLLISRPDGSNEEALVDLVFQPMPPLDGEHAAIFVQGNNVTEDKRTEAIRTAHNKVLELAIGDAPLETTLAELIRIVELTSQTGVLGSILLLDPDGKHVHIGAAPSLPPAYNAAIDGLEIGPCAGSCGTAAYLGAAVFVSDIANDPLWADYRAVALPNGLRACWSIPILTRGRKVLGTFAMYHREPREPTVRDLLLVDLITQTAALVIDREQAKMALLNIAKMIDSPQDFQSSPTAVVDALRLHA